MTFDWWPLLPLTASLPPCPLPPGVSRTSIDLAPASSSGCYEHTVLRNVLRVLDHQTLVSGRHRPPHPPEQKDVPGPVNENYHHSRPSSLHWMQELFEDGKIDTTVSIAHCASIISE